MGFILVFISWGIRKLDLGKLDEFRSNEYPFNCAAFQRFKPVLLSKHSLAVGPRRGPLSLDNG